MTDAIRHTILGEGWRGDDADELYKRVISRRDELSRNGGKQCHCCSLVKSTSAFDVDHDEWDGLARRCVSCRGSE